jgi:4-hydroxy-3-polyprenylbenzoate decarboxylase
VQKFDRRTCGMHWQIHKDAAADAAEEEARGRRIPVAVAIGADPAITYAATAPLPKPIDEFAFAGFLRGSRVELVPCLTQPDLMVPADAEIVLEGYVDPAERRREGPFGDHTGWYSLDDPFPVLHLTAITHRRDAVYAATVVGKPPMEDAWIGKATERLFLPLLRTTLPEVVDYDLPVEGVFHGCCIVSIRKRFPGHARKVMYGIWSTMLLSLTKTVIVVDEDVDVHDYRQVAWRAFGSVDPKRDIEIVEGPLDQLDHAAQREAYGGKIGIDATSKGPMDGFTRRWPQDIRMSPEVVARVTARWREYGLPAELGRPAPW